MQQADLRTPKTGLNAYCRDSQSRFWGVNPDTQLLTLSGR